MQNQSKSMTQADRKTQLLLDGAAYRIGIVYSKAGLRQELYRHPRMLGVIEQTIGIASSGLRAAAPLTASQLQTLLPLATASYSYLSRKRMLVPILGIGLLVATAIAVTGQHKRL